MTMEVSANRSMSELNEYLVSESTVEPTVFFPSTSGYNTQPVTRHFAHGLLVDDFFGINRHLYPQVEPTVNINDTDNR